MSEPMRQYEGPTAENAAEHFHRDTTFARSKPRLRSWQW